jgi:hypothetical protein
MTAKPFDATRHEPLFSHLIFWIGAAARRQARGTKGSGAE